MANSLTNAGQNACLWTAGNTPLNSGIAGLATSIRLYVTGSVPAKSGGVFNEPPVLNGYAPISVVFADWVQSLFSGNVQIVLQPLGTDPQWVASGAGISGIAGAFLVGQASAVLGWWERPGAAVDLASGDSLTLDDLTIRLV